MDEAAIRIVLKDEGEAPEPLTPTAPAPQPQIQVPPPPQPAPPRPVQPVAQQSVSNVTPEHIYADFESAMVSLGNDKKIASQMTEQLRKSGRTFSTVQEAIAANYAISQKSQPQTQPKGSASSNQFDPIAEAKKRREAEERRDQVEKAYASLYPTPSAVFDAEAEAKKHREAEERRNQINAAYEKLYPTPAQVFDAEAEARKQIDAENRREQIRKAYERLNPAPLPEAFNPVLEAKKRLDAEFRKRQIDEAYERLNPTPATPGFNPHEEAAKQRENEIRREQIRQAYESMYGSAEKTKSAFDTTLEVAEKMRGTMGGVFGTLAGLALDALAIYRERKAAAQKAIADQELANEARTKSYIDSLPKVQPIPEVKPAPEEKPQSVPVQQAKVETVQQPQTVSEKQVSDAGRMEGGEWWPNLPQPQTQQTQPPQPQPTSNQGREEGGEWWPTLPQPPPAQAAPQPQPKPIEVPKATVATKAEATEAANAAAPAEAAAGAEAAAVAGPVGLAIAAAKAVADAMISAEHTIIRGAGDFVAGIASASHDPSAPLAALGESASNVGDKLFYMSPVIGANVIAFGELTGALARTMQALDKTAERYGEYSPLIATAQAQSEVRQVLGDLARSQRAGPELARYLQVRSQMEQQFEETKIKILIKILPAINAIMTIITAFAGGVDNVVEAITSMPIADLAANLANIANQLQQNNIEEPDDPTDVILGRVGATPIQRPLD